jgi:hypothetical protein
LDKKAKMLVLTVFLLLSTAAFAQTGNITYVISTSGVQFQCSNGAWTDFGLSMTVQGYFNGVGPSQPMAETGLPTIKMSWFINGAAATATLTSSFNVANPASSGNTVSFDLMDDQPNIGGTFAVGTCTNGQTQPAITVAISSSTFINGVGISPNIPAVSGVPHIVNAFPAANNAGGSTGGAAASTPAPTGTAQGHAATTSTSGGMTSSQLGLTIGLVIGATLFVGAIIAVIKYKRGRRHQSGPQLLSPTNYVDMK